MTTGQDIINAGHQAHTEHPERLQTNSGTDCFHHISRVLEILGSPWSYVGKTVGDTQYTPTGFVPCIAKGRDGKPCGITGVSHDAITNGPLVYDILGGSHSGPDPSGHPAHIQAVAVPTEQHQPNNPPVPYPLGRTGRLESISLAVTPIPVAYPGDEFFIRELGQPLASDYAAAGQSFDTATVAWISRTLWRSITEGIPLQQSIMQNRTEWRTALGLPPL